MYSILLVIIYIAFISLGLPDSILGSAWPKMYGELNVPVSYAGIVTMIISVGTIISSINSAKLINKLGTGLVTAISVAMTAAGLIGFSVSGSFIGLCLWAVPYGLGAGSVDAALNNFVALHYKSRHMSWLHCFWGLGASLGPYIMGFYLTRNYHWSAGYRAVGIMQVVLSAVIFSTLFMWKGKKSSEDESNGSKQKSMKLIEVIRVPGAKKILIAFFCYCAVEATAGLWASSYMVLYKGISAQSAAKWASLFYLGITGGRFICGFVADKFGDKNMIRIGEAVCVAGILLIMLPFGTLPTLIGLVTVGLGCAPVYPSVIHATPDNFGAEKSQAIMGVQMACAYVGTTLMPPLFGLLADNISIGLYPFYMLIIEVIMILMVESLYKTLKKVKN